MRTRRPSSIESLPDDVLQLIFHTALDGANLLGEFSLTRLGVAVGISHISSGFRALALTSPTLWATITHEQWLWVLFAQLERSQYAPLTVVWKNESQLGDSDSPISVLGRVLEKGAARLRSLDLELKRDDFNVVLPHLHVDTPLLESLFLKLQETVEIDTSYREHLRLDAAFPTHSPSLRRLTLKDMVLPWPSSAHLWPALTHLDLSEYIQDRFTIEHFLMALQKLPHLQLLCITAGTVEDSILPVDMPSIPLKVLKTLDVGFLELDSAAAFSRRLIIPEECSVSFVAVYRTASATDLHVLLADVLPRQTHRSVRTLKLRQSGYGTFKDIVLEGEVGLAKPDSCLLSEGPAGPFKLHVDLVHITEMEVAIRAACALYDLTRTHTVTLSDISIPPDASIWRHLFRTCASAVTVNISEDAVDAFVEASRQSSEEDPLGIVFPNCRHLKLPHLGYMQLATKSALPDILRARRENGCFLQTLRVWAGDERDTEAWMGCAEEVNMPISRLMIFSSSS